MNNQFTVLFVLITVLWVISIARLMLLNVALWQIKEYRWDRMREHLKLVSTQKTIFGPLELAKWLLLFAYLTNSDVFGMFSLLIFVVYFLEGLILINEVRNHHVIRPKMTMKALLILAIIAISAIIYLSTFIIRGDGEIIGELLLVDRASGFVIAFVVLLFFPVSKILKLRIIQNAKKYRSTLKELVVVGVTGSYGKSSTKEVLGALLSGDDLAITPGNTNTEIGVAEFVLSNIKPSTKYFVSEMGAYRLGEINKLTQIAQPKIGIITAIGNQHLGLFGSRENIKKAKYELIQSLPADGTAIFNGDDPICVGLAEQTKHCRVITYGFSPSADLRAKIISFNENKIEVRFSGLVPDTNLHLSVVGKHQVSNVLAGIAGAIALGKTWPEIMEKISTIKMTTQTMEKFISAQGALIIDDSYNANTDGVISVIESLRDFPQKNKVVILTPMIELGSDSVVDHEKVGKTLAGNFVKTFYTGIDFKNDILRGARSVNNNYEIIIQAQGKAILKRLYPILNKDSVVLLEGRVPRIIRETLRTK